MAGPSVWLLVAAVAVETEYAGHISPDEIVVDPGEAVERAIAWLLVRD